MEKRDGRRRWTDKEIDYLAEACRRGDLTVKQIAMRMGKTANQVRHQMRDRGMKFAKRKRVWTDKNNATLRRLWAEGLSLRDIARHIPDTTHGGVERQAHELGLPRRRAPKVMPDDRCGICGINAEHMAGCPRPECAHYAPPVAQGERTLVGVVGALG